MNETKKLFTVLGVVVAVIAVIIIAAVVGGQREQEVIDEIKELMNSETGELIYIGRPGCSYCQQFSPILEDASDDEFELTFDIIFGTEQFLNTQDLKNFDEVYRRKEIFD